MSYTLEMQTERWGSWHLTTMAFATAEETLHFAEDATKRWPDLVARWEVVETDAAPTHTWSHTDGLTPIPREQS